MHYTSKLSAGTPFATELNVRRNVCFTVMELVLLDAKIVPPIGCPSRHHVYTNSCL